jgi:hypothetical protein
VYCLASDSVLPNKFWCTLQQVSQDDFPAKLGSFQLIKARFLLLLSILLFT